MLVTNKSFINNLKKNLSIDYPRSYFKVIQNSRRTETKSTKKTKRILVIIIIFTKKSIFAYLSKKNPEF